MAEYRVNKWGEVEPTPTRKRALAILDGRDPGDGKDGDFPVIDIHSQKGKYGPALPRLRELTDGKKTVNARGVGLTGPVMHRVVVPLLQENTGTRVLYLDGNDIDDEGAAALTEMLERGGNNTLRWLHMHFNPALSESAVVRLLDALESNCKSLEVFDCDFREGQRFHHLAARRDAIMSHRNKLRMRGQARVMFDVEDKVGLAQLYLRYREYPYPGLDVEKEKEKERVAALAASGSPPASSAGGAGAS